MTQVDTLPNVDTSMSTSKLKKSKETTSKKNSTGKKRTLRVGDISFSASSDDSDHMMKKRKISDDRIPDTQTMVRQLKTLDLSPSQMEHVLRANRKGRQGKSRLSLHRKAHKYAQSSTYCEISSSSENESLSSNKEMQPREEDVFTDSKLHTTASSQGNPAMSCESGGEWEKIDLTMSQVKNLDELEEATTKAFQSLIKEETESDEDVQYMGTLVSGLYEGIRSLVESIKEEFITPTDLEAYNKSAIGDEDKLALVKEKIGNVYDVRNVCSKEHLEALLNGPHGNRYHQNIAHVEHLKSSISHGQKEDVLSLDKLQDAERNADKVDADSKKEAADIKKKKMQRLEKCRRRRDRRNWKRLG